MKFKCRGNKRGGPKCRKVGGGLEVCTTLLRSGIDLKEQTIAAVVPPVSGRVSYEEPRLAVKRIGVGSIPS